ncbi:vitamin D3 receptor A-like isoform X2 [Dreissena polymorpha]|nr:vitamin D3 receptor A-like isoform X2 [Dreissena polymorpha]
MDLMDQSMDDLVVPDIGESLEMTSSRKRKTGGSKRAHRGSSGASSYTSIPLPPCKVCNGVATGYHFGVITCEACKAFFRRALIHQHNYKCIKDDNCVITDKKLGNCSACRLKKCIELGMSKGGVRRGRYSIAIRTQAILEAKAREASDVVSTAVKRQRLDDTVIEEITSMDDDGFSFDVFDGLLSVSQLGRNHLSDSSDGNSRSVNLDDVTAMASDDGQNTSIDDGVSATSYSPQMSPTIYVEMEEVPVYQQNPELELLIDAIMSCQEAVYPNLKKQYTNALQEVQYKIFAEYTQKEAVFGELISGRVSTEEFQQIFAETGLDLDDRLSLFNKKGRSMEETIAQYVNFAKLVPGFKTLNPKDVAKLLKASHFEFWMMGNFMLYNNQLGVTSSWDGSLKSTKAECCKFFDADLMDNMFNMAEKMQAMRYTLEEIALIRLIVLTYTDRCPLIESHKIATLQEKFLECLQYYISKTYKNPTRRLCQICDQLLSMRNVSHQNVLANKKFLTEWDFIMHDYPLWREMLSYDGES